MSRSLIRRQLLDFDPYRPGLSIEEIKERYGLSSVIKLASNENPLGASPKALQALGEMGFLVFPSQANFILVKPPMAAAELFEKLLRRGIIIRPLSSCGLTDHLRISIGNADENHSLVMAMRDILIA